MKNNFENKDDKLDLSKIINRNTAPCDVIEANKKIIPIKKNTLSEVLKNLNEHN